MLEIAKNIPQWTSTFFNFLQKKFKKMKMYARAELGVVGNSAKMVRLIGKVKNPEKLGN